MSITISYPYNQLWVIEDIILIINPIWIENTIIHFLKPLEAIGDCTVNATLFLHPLYLFMGELCFGGRWAPKLTKGPYNSSN